MMANVSDSEILILQAMWRLRALGSRGITIDDLIRQVSDLSRTEAAEKLGLLEARGFITISGRAGDDRFALSPLGAACIRQLQDRQLGDLTGVL